MICPVFFKECSIGYGAHLGGGNHSYTARATAVYVFYSPFPRSCQAATAVVDDIKSGFLTKMLATPVNRSAILFGRILSDMFRVAVQTIIILALAYVLGVYPQTGALGYVLVILTVGFFGLARSGI